MLYLDPLTKFMNLKYQIYFSNVVLWGCLKSPYIGYNDKVMLALRFYVTCVKMAGATEIGFTHFWLNRKLPIQT